MTTIIKTRTENVRKIQDGKTKRNPYVDQTNTHHLETKENTKMNAKTTKSKSLKELIKRTKTSWNGSQQTNKKQNNSLSKVKTSQPLSDKTNTVQTASVGKTKTNNCQKKSQIPIPVAKVIPRSRKILDESAIEQIHQISIKDVLTKLPPGVADIDEDKSDVFKSKEYAQYIVSYLMAKEQKFLIDYNDGGRNPEITSTVRAILVDWLIQVQEHLKLLPETLHLAVAITDQFSKQFNMVLGKYQLLGITSLFIASKMEERFPPEIEDLLTLTDNTYVHNEVITMEMKILETLKFDLNIPGPHFFLDRFFEAVHQSGQQHPVSTEMKHLCEYLLDLSMVDSTCIHHVPSKRAASALSLAQKLMHGGSDLGGNDLDLWTSTLQYYTTYSISSLKPCVKRLAQLLNRSVKSKYQGARTKFSSSRKTQISVSDLTLNSKLLNEICDN